MFENADFYQFGSGWCVTHDFDSVKASEAPPSTGVYYLVLLPTGWKLAVYRDDDSGKAMTHEEFWAGYICDLSGRLWSRALNSRRIEGRAGILAAHSHCFPRGRIVKDGDAYTIFHGHDQESTSESIRSEIELIFGLTGYATWVEDEKEECLYDDIEAIRALLREGVDRLYWPANSQRPRSKKRERKCARPDLR